VLFVKAQQQLRVGVAEMIDEAVVKPSVARPRIQRYVSDVEAAEEFGDDVAVPRGRLITPVADRPLAGEAL
jgi:hypothetical protein